MTIGIIIISLHVLFNRDKTVEIYPGMMVGRRHLYYCENSMLSRCLNAYTRETDEQTVHFTKSRLSLFYGNTIAVYSRNGRNLRLANE